VYQVPRFLNEQELKFNYTHSLFKKKGNSFTLYTLSAIKYMYHYVWLCLCLWGTRYSKTIQSVSYKPLTSLVKVLTHVIVRIDNS